jgi:hypothetical protein
MTETGGRALSGASSKRRAPAGPSTQSASSQKRPAACLKSHARTARRPSPGRDGSRRTAGAPGGSASRRRLRRCAARARPAASATSKTRAALYRAQMSGREFSRSAAQQRRKEVEAERGVVIEGGLLHRAAIRVELRSTVDSSTRRPRRTQARGLAELGEQDAQREERRRLADQVVVRARIRLEVPVQEAAVVVEPGEPCRWNPAEGQPRAGCDRPTATTTPGRPAPARTPTAPRWRKGTFCSQSTSNAWSASACRRTVESATLARSIRN